MASWSTTDSLKYSVMRRGEEKEEKRREKKEKRRRVEENRGGEEASLGVLHATKEYSDTHHDMEIH